ncbi:hypothetical protein C4D60_Mb05t23820 [Musa balbisiana]|uniref:Uncharacterized protein n=1 Tax=Musa balbisiana TaxID=52838 RepID=A0A4S8JYG0_MUSBA|nr:hypothetical protein C4D60_Mb05t23820 [Musa balbisiana]
MWGCSSTADLHGHWCVEWTGRRRRRRRRCEERTHELVGVRCSPRVTETFTCTLSSPYVLILDSPNLAFSRKETTLPNALLKQILITFKHIDSHPSHLLLLILISESEEFMLTWKNQCNVT